MTKLGVEALEFSHRWPHFLPDGRRFLYLAQRAMGESEKNGIYVASLDGGEPVLLFNGNTNVIYAPPGYLLYHRERTLLARPFDPKSLRFSEEAFPVAEDVQFLANFAYSVFSASHQGLLAYQTGSGGGQSQLTWLDRNGKPAGAVGGVGHLAAPRLSYDGRRVAVGILDAQAGVGDIWIHDLARNTPTRFTFDKAGENTPLWSPDDSRIVFTTTRKGAGDLYVKDSTGTANEAPLVVSNALKVPQDWSRDGRTILYQENDPRAKTLWDLWTYSIDDRKARPFLQTPFNEVLAKFSPDGRWIAYASNESGREEVYVVAFPGPGGKWQISTAGGRAPCLDAGWSGNRLSVAGKRDRVGRGADGTLFPGGDPEVVVQNPYPAAARPSVRCHARWRAFSRQPGAGRCGHGPRHPRPELGGRAGAMTLAAGSRLGPYEILSAVGAGGMGEVYKAKDTRLERTVAVKVLPA